MEFVESAKENGVIPSRWGYLADRTNFVLGFET